MRIIIVCDPKRVDFFHYLIPYFERHEVFLLWNYEKEIPDLTSKPAFIKEIFWKDYRNPEALIKSIEPDSILFFEILDLWQISLIVYCTYYKIITYFFEHGVGNSVEQVISRYFEIPFGKRVLNSLSKIKAINKIFKSRMFYYSSIKYLYGFSLLKFLSIPLYYKFYLPNPALSKLKFRERTPKFAVLFNQNNVPPFLLYNTIPPEDIFIGGVPFFDKYYAKTPLVGNHIVLIDHPYLEMGILGWTNEHHESIAIILEEFARKHNIKIYIKLHPKSEKGNWLRYNLDPNYIVIEQEKDITDILLSAQLVLGYSSTLMNALICSRKNIVLLGWHPIPKIFGDDLSKTQLCHVSFNPNDLLNNYSDWLAHNLALDNIDNYKKYLKEYNYPFDGRATERIFNFLDNNFAGK